MRENAHYLRMSVLLNVVLSDDLNREIDHAANETESNKSEIFRKALQLYLEARKGAKEGFDLGLVNRDTEQLETKFVGL
jgi:predicted transcriptional regulator